MQALKFRPLIKERVWGGDKLVRLLGKPGASDKPLGECWELVDLPDEQSVVEGDGPWAGKTLADLVATEYEALMGPVSLDHGRFPLLVKTIDARETLSVQVHPDENTAPRFGGRAKSEAWYIISAEPGSRIYLGLRHGTTAEKYQKALEEGKLEDVLLSIPARVGDLIPVAPGLVHAIGGGVLLAEVQQPSDTTYRVYDWGRLGLDKKPRELHLEQALASIHFDAQSRVRCGANIEMDLKLFRLRVFALAANTTAELNSIGPRVLIALEGESTVHVAGEQPMTFSRGETIMLPHICRPTQLRTTSDARIMYVTFPSEPKSFLFVRPKI